MNLLPADICNMALDAIGSEVTLGDVSDGSREAQVLLRSYGNCLRVMLRTANWNFASKTAPLVLLADATAATVDVGTIVPQGFIYEYAYPTDCMRAINVLWRATYAQTPTIPIMSGVNVSNIGNQFRRARFILANDTNYPPQPGQGMGIAGVSPVGRLVVLTNAPNAQIKYSSFVPYPSMWDSLFLSAFVSYLASEVALPITKDKKIGMAIRREQYQIAKRKIEEARIADGNEQPVSSDIKVDWMQARYSGASRRPWEGELGYFTTEYDGAF